MKAPQERDRPALVTVNHKAEPRVAVSSTRTVERALHLLAEVCGDGAASLAECARRTQLPPSTALRLLRTLAKSGFVTRDPDGTFRAGARLLQLGAIALGQQSTVGLAEPALRRIVSATGESAYLGVLGPDHTALYAAMAEGTHGVRHRSSVGRTVPLAGTAIGAALTGPSAAVGYVVARGVVEPDVTEVAATIRRAGGIAGALSLVGPTYRLDDESVRRFGNVVSAEAKNLAAQLGAANSDADARNDGAIRFSDEKVMSE